MASTLKKLVSCLNPKTFSAKEEMIYVAAFGKHPGWNDHIDDIGVSTELLVAFKRKLYVEGIGGNIDSGKWLKVAEANQGIEFGHTFLSISGKAVLIGRLWASADGKGRSSYPMAVCIQCTLLGLDWILETLPACLKDIEKSCRGTESAEQVVQIIEKAQVELRAKAQTSPPADDFKKTLIVDASPLPDIADLSEFQTEYGLIRILYFLEREVDRFQSKSSGVSSASSSWSPKMLRIPSVPEESEKRLLLWVSFMVWKYGFSIPLLIFAPDHHPWIDVLLGDATAAQFYCLKTSDEAIPLTSRIPYNIEPEYVTTCIAMMKRKQAEIVSHE